MTNKPINVMYIPRYPVWRLMVVYSLVAVHAFPKTGSAAGYRKTVHSTAAVPVTNIDRDARSYRRHSKRCATRRTSLVSDTRHRWYGRSLVPSHHRCNA